MFLLPRHISNDHNAVQVTSTSFGAIGFAVKEIIYKNMGRKPQIHKNTVAHTDRDA